MRKIQRAKTKQLRDTNDPQKLFKDIVDEHKRLVAAGGHKPSFKEVLNNPDEV